MGMFPSWKQGQVIEIHYFGDSLSEFAVASISLNIGKVLDFLAESKPTA